MKAIGLFIFLTAATFSQSSSYFPPISDQLKAYLQLEGSQVEQINAINSDFGKFTQDHFARQVVLLTEIAAETSKTTVDPMTLGVRYAELEAIRRQLKDEAAKVRTRAIAVLNDSQKALLKTLDQAMRLQAEIYDGQCQNLLEPAPPMSLTYSESGTATGTSGGSFGYPAGSNCGTSWISTPTFAGFAQAQKNIQK